MVVKEKIDIPKSIREAGVTEEKFYNSLDNMSEQAFDDQFTGANPRYPLISEIKQMHINAF